jgi:hypothetical protein
VNSSQPSAGLEFACSGDGERPGLVADRTHPPYPWMAPRWQVAAMDEVHGHPVGVASRGISDYARRVQTSFVQEERSMPSEGKGSCPSYSSRGGDLG